MQIEIRLLGSFTAVLDGERTGAFHSPRIQALIAYLALHLGTPVSRSHLAFLFWPDSSEAQARTNLRKFIHQMRQAVPKELHLLDMDTISIQLNAPNVRVDALEFNSAIEEAARARHAGDAVAEQAALEKAAAIYAGDFLPGFYDEWVPQVSWGARQLASC